MQMVLPAPRYLADVGRSQRWRFNLLITEGPNSGLGAGPWRIWIHKDDIYVASANQVNIVKASLHASGKWRIGYTAEHMQSDQPLWPRSHDRAAWKFDPPPVVDGVQEAFVIASTRAALRPTPSDSREAVVTIDDRWDVLTGVRVWITEPHIEVAQRERLVFDEPLVLSSGRLVWLQAFAEYTEPRDPVPVPVGQLIRVMIPGQNDVSCPGYLVVDVNVG